MQSQRNPNPNPNQIERVGRVPAPSAALKPAPPADSLPATLNPAANPSPSDWPAASPSPLPSYAGQLTPAADWPLRPSALPADNPIIDMLAASRAPASGRHSSARGQQQAAGASSGASPLLVALVSLSVAVSVALVWLLVLGFSAGASLGAQLKFPKASKIRPLDK